jgi:hypothetical protein
VRVARVFRRGDSIVLVLAHGGGLTEWKLDPAEKGYTSTLEAGNAKVPVTFTRR